MEKTEKQVWREVANYAESLGSVVTAMNVRDEANRRWPRKPRTYKLGNTLYRYNKGVLENKVVDNWAPAFYQVADFRAVAALADNPYEDD